MAYDLDTILQSNENMFQQAFLSHQQEMARIGRIEENKRKLLSDPAKLDKIVADYYSAFSPNKKAPDYKKYGTRIDAVNAAIPNDHPQKRDPYKFKFELIQDLMDPKYQGVPVGQLMPRAFSSTLNDEKVVDIYRYKRREDASLLEFDREDQDTRRFPGYDKWLESVKTLEHQQWREESWLPTKGTIAASAGMGAAAGAIFGLGGGAVPGAAAFVAGDFIATPITKLLHATEWYRTRQQGNLADKGAAMLADLGIYAAADVGLSALKLSERFVKKAPKLAKEIGMDSVGLTGQKATKINKAGLPVPYEKTQKGSSKEAYDILKKLEQTRTKRSNLPEPYIYHGEEVHDVQRIESPQIETGIEKQKQIPYQPEISGSNLVQSLTGVKPIEDMTGHSRKLWSNFSLEDKKRALNRADTVGIENAVFQVSEERRILNEFLDSEIQKRTSPVLLDMKRNKYPYGKIIEEYQNKGKNVTRNLKLRKRIEDFVKEYEDTVGPLDIHKDLGIKEFPSLEGIKKTHRNELEKILRKLSIDPKTIAIAMGVTGSIAVADLVNPNSSEASVLGKLGLKTSNAAAKLVKEMNFKDMMKTLRSLNLLEPVPHPNNHKLLSGVWQEQLFVNKLASAEKGGMNAIVKRKNPLPIGLEKYLSPYTFAEIFYKPKANVSIQIASLQEAVSNNSRYAKSVFDNIMASVPEAKGQTKAIIKEMEPLAKRYGKEYGAFRQFKMKFDTKKKALESMKKNLKNTKGNKYERTKERIKELEDWVHKNAKKHKELEPQAQKFMEDWELKVKELAKKYPSTRIALAAEDTVDHQYYPWLKSLMTENEKEAVLYIKKFNEEYARRIEDAGHPVIKERPYMHHGHHPAWRSKKLKEELENLQIIPGDSAPYTKFFQRTKYSRMMVPDINYNMMKYIPDAENRIHGTKFWGKGNSTAGVPRDPEGWWAHKQSPIVKNNPALRDFWNRVEDSFKPVEATPWNKFMNRYAMFEVLNLIALSPSVAFKHLLKMTGTFASTGVRETLKHAPKAMRTYVRSTGPYKKMVDHFKIPSSEIGKLEDELYRSVSSYQRYRSVMADLELDTGLNRYGTIMDKMDRKMRELNEAGAVLVKGIENIDRAHTVMAASEMALKRGLTDKDALYAVYDNILKNNFLGGALNPSWMRNPTVRTLFLFQNTPFKILERRLLGFFRTKEAFKLYGKKVSEAEAVSLWKELSDLKHFMFRGQQELKNSLVFDALNSEKDVFGTPAVKQFMKEALITGAVIAGSGKLLEADLFHHMVHFPIVKTDRDEIGLLINPAVAAGYKTAVDESEEFFLKEFMDNWFGRKGLIPQTVWKSMRLSEDDIPDIYKDSKLRYLFSVPAKGAH